MTKNMNNVFQEYDENPEWQKYIVGVDFCGAPWEGEIKKFTELFQVCRSKNIKLTIHTAEIQCHAFETSDILKFKPERVGHYCYASDEEIQQLIEYNGLIEICPTSNIITGEMENLTEHPITKFHKNGAQFSICTDDLLLFNKNVSEEIYYISESHPELFTFEKIEKIQVDAMKASFIKEENTKLKILKQIQEGFEKVKLELEN